MDFFPFCSTTVHRLFRDLSCSALSQFPISILHPTSNMTDAEKKSPVDAIHDVKEQHELDHDETYQSSAAVTAVYEAKSRLSKFSSPTSRFLDTHSFAK